MRSIFPSAKVTSSGMLINLNFREELPALTARIKFKVHHPSVIYPINLDIQKIILKNYFF